MVERKHFRLKKIVRVLCNTADVVTGKTLLVKIKKK